jgi:hypothetical protein
VIEPLEAYSKATSIQRQLHSILMRLPLLAIDKSIPPSARSCAAAAYRLVYDAHKALRDAKRHLGSGQIRPLYAANPEASAEIMKARFAEIEDDGIPECLRREAKAKRTGDHRAS